MKVYGNYYKNTKDGKRKGEFELELKAGDLTSLRRQATEILKEDDKEFRGVRELFIKLGNAEPKKEAPKKEISTEEQEIRQLAKEKGIKSWHVKKIDNLKEELEALKDE